MRVLRWVAGAFTLASILTSNAQGVLLVSEVCQDGQWTEAWLQVHHFTLFAWGQTCVLHDLPIRSCATPVSDSSWLTLKVRFRESE